MNSTAKKLSRGKPFQAIDLSGVGSPSSPPVRPNLLRTELVSSACPSIGQLTSDSDAVSPVGLTLKNSDEHLLSHDLSRTTVSESFNVGANVDDSTLDIRIFFPNRKAIQFSVQDGERAHASALLDFMADYLEIDSETASEAFALWLVSPFLEVQLKPHHVPFEIHEKWPAFLRKFTTADEYEIALDEPLLVIKRNFKLTIEKERLYMEEYERLTEVLYLDAKDQYMTGRYLVDVETALELAALQLAIDFGPYETKEEAFDLIRDNLGLLVPEQHLSTVRSFLLFGISAMECKSGLEKAMIEEYQVISDRFRNSYERRKYYLEILQKTPFYGAAFFTGTRSRRTWGILSSLFGPFVHNTGEVTVGINHEYITVVNPVTYELITCQLISNCTWRRSSADGKHEAEMPLLVLQYPDGSTLAHTSRGQLSADARAESGGGGTAMSVGFRRRSATLQCMESADGRDVVEIVEGGEVDAVNAKRSALPTLKFHTSGKKSTAPPLVNRKIFSKQAIMIEDLLNDLYSDLYQKLSGVHKWSNGGGVVRSGEVEAAMTKCDEGVRS